MLRIKQMHDALEQWGRTLEDKVRRQVDEIQRPARLKRYLPSQVADEILKGEEASRMAGTQPAPSSGGQVLSGGATLGIGAVVIGL